MAPQRRAASTAQPHISTLAVEIRALQVGPKQMTQSVFRQLPMQRLVDAQGHLCGVPWGYINYWWGQCAAQSHLHVVWQHGETLYRDCVEGPALPWRLSEDYDRQIETHANWLDRLSLLGVMLAMETGAIAVANVVNVSLACGYARLVDVVAETRWSPRHATHDGEDWLRAMRTDPHADYVPHYRKGFWTGQLGQYEKSPLDTDQVVGFIARHYGIWQGLTERREALAKVYIANYQSVLDCGQLFIAV